MRKGIKDTEGVVNILGREAAEDIINKEWKTADLPSPEELAAEKHKSPKARSNANSRKNLVQYKKNKPKSAKKKALENLKTKRNRTNIDPFDYIELKTDEKKLLLKTFLPLRTILASAEEEVFFYTMVNSLLSDFDEEDMTAGDLEDVVGLAINRVIVDRLLEAAARDPMVMLDVGPSIERFRKQTKELKANLANRRADRTDPKAKQNFSIVDLVHAYTDKRKEELEERREAAKSEKLKYLNKKDKSPNKKA